MFTLGLSFVADACVELGCGRIRSRAGVRSRQAAVDVSHAVSDPVFVGWWKWCW